jgi:hypothetical protein
MSTAESELIQQTVGFTLGQANKAVLDSISAGTGYDIVLKGGQPSSKLSGKRQCGKLENAAFDDQGKCIERSSAVKNGSAGL